MNSLIISYSMTGNNEVLATALASGLSADHVRISVAKPQTYFTIAMDMLFNRTPKVNPAEINVGEYDLVTFVGPVWMGHIPSPFRAYFRKYRKTIKRYTYVSLSGGADGPNTKLSAELKKRMKSDPSAVVNLLIADMLPDNPKPTREETESYRLNEEEARKLTFKILDTINAE